MLTRYSSSIFSFNSFAVFALRTARHTTLHICGSLIWNCITDWSSQSTLPYSKHKIRTINPAHTSTPTPPQKKRRKRNKKEKETYLRKETNLIRGILNTITTKNFTKILCTVNNLFRLAVRKGSRE